ncbi:uncharacterized protein LOC114301562 [Camellia sinensis]|uniref:uncharacterized protein LOC114301562 n=1 Tax=Camellia sinensis TaxID=4442 RepID=UPI0010362978|nr:uncharacterized protein LOC114301562 [Camellia sinensis]
MSVLLFAMSAILMLSAILRQRKRKRPRQKRTMVAHPSTCSFSMPSTSLAPQTNWPTLTTPSLQEDLCTNEELEDMHMSPMVSTRAHINSCRHSLGKMDVLCPFCSALHWMDEKLVKSSPNCPLFGTCCSKGKVKLPPLITPPSLLQALYDGNDDKSKSFRRYTRVYNATNAFTSLGATLDPRVLTGRGPTLFTIHWELRHQTGSLLPQSGQDAAYAQLYIY